MSSITMKRVKDLKQTLLKHQQNNNNTNNDDNDPVRAEQILDIISLLDKCSIDVNILASTLVGAVVSKFKSSSNVMIAAQAKALVKKWKQLAKQSGISSSNAASSSKTNSSQSATAIAAARAKSASTPTKAKSGSAASSAGSSAAANNQTEMDTAWNHLPGFRKSSALKLYETFLQSQQAALKQQQRDQAQLQSEEAETTEASATSTTSSSTSTSTSTSTTSPTKKTILTPETITSIIITKATKVETAIQTYSKNNKKTYIDKIRSLIFNLKKNEPLRNSIILSKTTPIALVQMTSKQLQTIEKQKATQDKVKSLQGSRRLDWEKENASKINEMCGIKGDLLKASLFTCGRCKSHKTTSTQKQTRSADEPMTVFVYCENCGNRWKC